MVTARYVHHVSSITRNGVPLRELGHSIMTIVVPDLLLWSPFWLELKYLILPQVLLQLLRLDGNLPMQVVLNFLHLLLFETQGA